MLLSLRHLGRHNAEGALLTRLYLVLGAESFDTEGPAPRSSSIAMRRSAVRRAHF